MVAVEPYVMCPCASYLMMGTAVALPRLLVLAEMELLCPTL